MSDEHEPDSKLVLRAEAVARSLELREPDWDAFEARVTSSLASAPADADDALLLSPLPELEEERGARDVEPQASVSLLELAQATVAKRAEKEAANLAKESLAFASQKRAQHERPAPQKPAAPEQAAVPTAVPASVPRKAAERSSAWDSRGPWIGVGIAAVGLAASFGLYFAGRQAQSPLVAQPTAISTVSTLPEASAKLAETQKPPTPAAATPTSAEPSALPSAEVVAALEPDAAQRSASGPGEPPLPGKAERAVPMPGKPTAAAAKAVAPERVVLDDEHAATPIPPKGGEKPSELRPAELKPTDALGDRPSTGAAQAAVGAVLGAARSCVAGQSAPSSATLVFGSNGQVESVRVSGAAAGTPAAGCVESALKKARVQPFAAPSFSLGVTIRPL